MKEVLRRIGNLVVFLLTGKGPVADKAVEDELVDLSGQGRDKNGR